MLGSDYRELIVKKVDQRGKPLGILIGGAAVTVLLLGISLVSGRMLLLLLAAAAGVGTWYLLMQTRIEYEYIISGDELRVTKIIAESKRKEMLAVSVTKFTAFGCLKDAEPLSGAQTLVLACAQQDASAYYADFDHDTLGACRLVFTPNDDILCYLAKHLPRSLHFSYEAES